VIAHAMMRPEAFQGRALELTGPTALSHDEIADIIRSVTGTPVRPPSSASCPKSAC
jgi:uncharacterized protein YbjT (DUF2867 family)